MARKRHTAREIEQIVEQYKAGTSAKDISRIYGIHRTTLYDWVLKAEPNHETREDRVKALKAQNQRLKIELADAVLEMIFERSAVRADKAGDTD